MTDAQEGFPSLYFFCLFLRRSLLRKKTVLLTTSCTQIYKHTHTTITLLPHRICKLLLGYTAFSNYLPSLVKSNIVPQNINDELQFFSVICFCMHLLCELINPLAINTNLLRISLQITQSYTSCFWARSQWPQKEKHRMRSKWKTQIEISSIVIIETHV